MAHYDAENPFEADAPKNPFEDEDDDKQRSKNQPAFPSKNVTTPSYNQPNPDLVARADALKRREEEINRREAALDNRAQNLASREISGSGGPPPNWPRCRPLIRHNISEDMPTPETVRLVRMAYGGWIAGYALLGYNIVVQLAVLIQDKGASVGDFILSIVFFILLPIIWFTIYRILYRAARKTKAALYIVYWIFYFFVMLTNVFFVIGVPATGAGGIFWMFDAFASGYTASGVMLLINGVLWALLAIFCVWIFIASRIEYNRAGGLAAAKRNVKDGAISVAKSNPDLVAQGAKMAATEAAKHPDLIVEAAKHSRE